MTETVVYKIGGSLLGFADLPARLRKLLADRGRHRPLLVVGGGEAAELVRRWDRIHHLNEERAHWLAFRALELGEGLLLDLLPETRLVVTRVEARLSWEAGSWPLLNARSFVKQEEPRVEQPLPHCWDVSSDSIAAWVALCWPADELVLLKSASLPEPISVAEAARRGLVDAYFPQLAPQLPRLRWSNLRAESPSVQSWLG